MLLYNTKQIYISFYIYNGMEAYRRPLISRRRITTIVRQRWRDNGEIEKKSKSTFQRMFT